MRKQQKTDSIARVSTAVAIASLLLNAFQFYAASHEREQKRRQEAADRAPRAFYAYANDATLARLYAGEFSSLAVRHGSDADSQIRTWLEHAGRDATSFRKSPTASFLVISSRQDFDIPGVAAVVRHGPSVPDTVLLTRSSIGPKESVLVPLDFRPPGRDFAEPDTPPEVLVQYGEQETLSVRPTDRIDWMGGQFFRGLVRGK